MVQRKKYRKLNSNNYNLYGLGGLSNANLEGILNGISSAFLRSSSLYDLKKQLEAQEAYELGMQSIKDQLLNQQLHNLFLNTLYNNKLEILLNLLNAVNSFSNGGHKYFIGSAMALGTKVADAAGKIIGNGYSSGVGDAISSLHLPGGGLIGGVFNALFGEKVDKAAREKAKTSINELSNFQSAASNFDLILGPTLVDNIGLVYSGGVFVRGRAEAKNARLRDRLETAQDLAYRNVENNVDTLVNELMANALSNYAADGGSIYIKPSKRGTFTAVASKHNMGVQEFASKVLNNKEDYSPAMVKKANFARNASKWHAFGGDLLTHGATFDDGFTYIGNGGTHEENPNEGVLMGIAPDGKPNLVEEGEVVWNDYVFSDRLKHPKTGKSFAKEALKASKESEERPNDPISRNGKEDALFKLEELLEMVRDKILNKPNKFDYGGKKAKKGDIVDGIRVDMGDTIITPKNKIQSTYTQASNLKDYLDILDKYKKLSFVPEYVSYKTPEVSILNNYLEQLLQEENYKRLRRKEALFNNEDILDNPFLYAQGGELGHLFGEGDELTFELRIALGNLFHQYGNTPTNAFVPNWNNLSYEDLLSWAKSKNLDIAKDLGISNLRLFNNAIKNAQQGGTPWDNKGYFNDYLVDSGAKESFKALEVKALPIDIQKPSTPEVYTKEDGTRGIRITDYTSLYDSKKTRGVNGKIDKEGKVKTIKSPKEKNPMDWSSIGANALRGMSIIPGIAGLINPSTPYTMSVPNVRTVKSSPVGLKLTYTPIDINYQANRLASLERAAANNIMNMSGGNRGMAIAGILSGNYNSLLAMADALRQADNLNFVRKAQVNEFNRATDLFNSLQALQAAIANQQRDEALARMGMQAQEFNYNLLDNAYSNRMGNILNIFGNLANIGTDILNRKDANKAYKAYLENMNTGKKAKGGRINKRRRGLTY